MSHPPQPDPSRVEAGQAGAFTERAEAAAGVPPGHHVSAEELAPDALAQQANAAAVQPEPPTRLALVLVATVAVAVALAVIAVAVAVSGT